MWMHRHTPGQAAHVSFEEIEKNEWLQFLAKVRWTHEANDRTPSETLGTMNDFTGRQD
jgi:hypothetical protein